MVDQIGGINSSLPDLSGIDGMGASSASSSSGAKANKPYADLSTIGQDTTQFSGKNQDGGAGKKRHRIAEMAASVKQKFSGQSEE